MQDSKDTFSGDSELDMFFAETQEEPAQPLATDGELVATMQRVADLRVRKDVLDTELKIVNKEIADLQEKILVTFDARSITKMSVKGAGMFYVQSSPYPSVKNIDEFCKWLDDRNIGEIAKRTANFQTLRSWFKERLASGGDLPDESVLTHFMKRDIRVRKAS
jgi:hypothetical protein